MIRTSLLKLAKWLFVPLAALAVIFDVTFGVLELHRTVFPDSLSEPTGAPPSQPLPASDVNSLRDENATQQQSSEAEIPGQRDGLNEILASLLPPPTNVQASVTGVGAEGEVALSWDAVPSAVGYRVYRSSVSRPSVSDKVEIGTTETTSFTDRGPGVGRWNYRVAAYTNTDQSEESDFAQALVRLPAPTGLVAEADASTSETVVRLTWNAVAGAGRYFVYRGGRAGDVTRYRNAYTTESVDDSPIVGANSYQVAAYDYRQSNMSHLSDVAVVNIAELERKRSEEAEQRRLEAEYERKRSEEAEQRRLEADYERIEEQRLKEEQERRRQLATQRAHAAAVDRAKRTYAAAVDRANQTHTSAVDRAKQTLASAADRAKQTHAAAVDRAKQTHAAAVDRAKQTHASAVKRAKQTHASAVKRAKQTLAAAADRSQRSVERAKRSYASAVDRAKRTLADALADADAQR